MEKQFEWVKEFLKFAEKLKYLEALLILLNHSNKDIVFYSLGILTNALSDEELKYWILVLINLETRIKQAIFSWNNEASPSNSWGLHDGRLWIDKFGSESILLN